MKLYTVNINIFLGLGTNVEVIKSKAMYRSSVAQIDEEVLQNTCDTSSENTFKILKYTISAIPNVKTLTQSHKFIKSLPDRCQQFYNSQVDISSTEAINICKKTLNQNTDLWQHERQIRITASNAYELVTYMSNKNPNWHNKIEKYLNTSFMGTSATRYGNLMEGSAIKRYQEQLDFTVTVMGLIINSFIPWLGYSPDGVVEKRHIIEIKSLQVGKDHSATKISSFLPFLQSENDNVVLKKKHKYYCQVQLGMFITGIHACHFIVYCSFDDSCLVVDVQYDEKFIDDNLWKLEFIYFTYILLY